MIIDSHVHLGCDRYKKATLADLLRSMDGCSVDRAVACAVDQALVIDNRAGNDLLIDAVRRHPDRLAGLACANPWYGQRAVEELQRAVGEGLCGLKIKSPVQGFHLSDEILWPLLEECAKLELPVYCHTGTPVTAMPFQLAYAARMFPTVSFIMGHTGASDFWNDVPYAVDAAENILLETSLVSPTTASACVLELIPKIGPERVLFGSDFPMQSMSLELAKTRNLIDDAAARELVLGGNAARLFLAASVPEAVWPGKPHLRPGRQVELAPKVVGPSKPRTPHAGEWNRQAGGADR